MAKRSTHKTVQCSRQTIKRYRDAGFDVDTDGKPDPVKIARVKAYKATVGKAGTSRDENARYWDTRFRKAKAKRAEKELALTEGEFVRTADVVAEWRGRVIGLRTLLTGLGREVAPRLVGKNAREVQALIDVRCFEILRTFAHQEYMPTVEP